MSTKEKLIERFKGMPKDFTWDELVRLLGFFGYVEDDKGKTSGSKVSFDNGDDSLQIHKPHPGNILLAYVMRKVYKFLKQNGLI